MQGINPVSVPNDVILPGTHNEITYCAFKGAEHDEIVNVPVIDGDPTERKVP